MTINGGDGCNRLANEAHRVVENVPALFRYLFDVVVVLLPAGDAAGAKDDLAVLVRQNRLHAGKSKRLRSIDTADPRVRMRAAQDARIEHSRKLNIVGVCSLAGYALDRINAWCRIDEDL